MSLRFRFWAAGLLLGFGSILLLAGTPWAELAPLTFVASVTVVALVGEVIAALPSRHRTSSARARRMPDGIIDLEPMRGVMARPNTSDERFSVFQSMRPDEENRNPPPRGAVMGRSSPALVGKLAVVSVFLGRDGRSWTDLEIAEAHEALTRAGRWLEREAGRYQIPLNVSLAATYFVADEEEADDVEMTFAPPGEGEGPIEARAVTKALVDLTRAAAQLGFADAQKWLTQINPLIEADLHVWILYPLRKGRSLAIPLDATELEGVSLAVCYADEGSFPEPLAGSPYIDPVTLVHEMMHLFGASDKYGVPLRSYPADSVTSHDVMRLSKTRLAQLRVDARTASEIGWTSLG